MYSPRGMNEFWIDPASPYHKPVYASGKRFVFLIAPAAWRSALEAKMFQTWVYARRAHGRGRIPTGKAAGCRLRRWRSQAVKVSFDALPHSCRVPQLRRGPPESHSRALSPTAA